MSTLKKQIIAGAAGILLLCGWQATQPQRWEYKVIQANMLNSFLEIQLNALATEGWTVVSAASVESNGGQGAVTRVILQRKGSS